VSATDSPGSAARGAGNWFNKPVLPVWHVLIAAERE
jgi:hypothetical protein